MKINGEEHNDLCVGIDLGTTNSVVSTINIKPNGDVVSKVVDVSRPVDIFNSISGEAKFQSKKMPTLPSCVYYNEENNYTPLVGDFAKNRYSLRPHLVAKSIKSQMGKEFAEGMADEVLDKTPAKISSRILKHILDCVSRIYRTEIKDAIITVPANFNPIMCQATRDAAEMAGITIRNSDGSERPILLSEPNAVIYDFINQAKNGEIARQILDLSEKKNVLVFDLGGGTLDITYHTIVQRSDYQEALRVNEIATNRYTLLGGDDFDEALAQFMFQRYLNQYRDYPDVTAKIHREEPAVMSQLKTYAEELKLELSSRHSTEYESSGWDDDDNFSVGGNISATGYAYDDILSTEQLENVLRKFMGDGLLFMDYKNIDNITNTRNIIYPILDVLQKAGEKLQTDNVTVDAIIMNGGMSRFYMVIDRIRQFFEMEPIIALDPDQAVARGAAVYHYYLHKYEALKDDMRMLGIKSAADYEAKEDEALQTINAKSRNAQLGENLPKESIPQIQFGNTILNDSLYMATQNAVRVEIIPTGAELPYESKLMTGFRLTPGTKHFDIPILTRNINNVYQNIARGNMFFEKDYPDGAYITFKVMMSSSKVIDMKAWTSQDINGKNIVEEGQTSITIGRFTANNAYVEASSATQNIAAPKSFSKILYVPNGIPADEKCVEVLRKACKEYDRYQGKTLSLVRTNMKRITKRLCNAVNGSELAPTILKYLKLKNEPTFKQRLYIIARKNSPVWTAGQRMLLAQQCMEELEYEIHYSSLFGGKDVYRKNGNALVHAFMALGICGNSEQLAALKYLREERKYLSAALFTYSRTKADMPWMCDMLIKEAEKAKNGFKNKVHECCNHIGIAIHTSTPEQLEKLSISREAIVNLMCDVITSRTLSKGCMHMTVLGIGLICDQRFSNTIDSNVVRYAHDTIEKIPKIYGCDYANYGKANRNIILKLLEGRQLTSDEEKYLLTVIEGEDD